MVYIVLSLLGGLIGFAVTRSMLIATLNFFMIGFASYDGLPTLAPDFAAPYMLVATALFLAGIGAFAVKRTESGKMKTAAVGVGGAFGVFMVLMVAYLATTPQMFHALAYRDLLGEVKTVAFSEALPPIDQSQIRTIDEGLARRRGHELLGADPGLGAQVGMGNFSIQNYRGKLVWVAPLEHKGLIKWFVNDMTNGYVRVSATNYMDAELVHKVGNEDIKMSIGMNGAFHDNIFRFVYPLSVQCSIQNTE